MIRAFVNGNVLTRDGFRSDLAVLVEGPRIRSIVAAAECPADAAVEDLAGDLLVPGFVDVQVNGGGGVLFNDAPTVETIAAIGAAHRRFGTTGFLPTLISDDLDVVRRGIAAVEQAIDAGVPGVLGIHVEGPFLSAQRKGIHDASKLRSLDDEGFDVVTSLRRGRTLVTLAPERTTPQMIRRLVDHGVIVAAGHTDAGYDEVRAALDSGLSGFTHLFNAMSPLQAREPGAVGAALEDEDSWCGLILDGVHVNPATARIALRCKPLARLMLVTDAMPPLGAGITRFKLGGRSIEVAGAACVDDDGRLAGSNLDMASAVRNAGSMLGIGLDAALRMATLHPASYLGLDQSLGIIEAGYRANLARLDSNVQVKAVWIDGHAYV